jgi:hypothetical protein
MPLPENLIKPPITHIVPKTTKYVQCWKLAIAKKDNAPKTK